MLLYAGRLLHRPHRWRYCHYWYSCIGHVVLAPLSLSFGFGSPVLEPDLDPATGKSDLLGQCFLGGLVDEFVELVAFLQFGFLEVGVHNSVRFLRSRFTCGRYKKIKVRAL